MYLPDMLCPRNVYELRFLKYTFTKAFEQEEELP